MTRNVIDETTDLLLELNRYCFEKHIDLQIENVNDDKRSTIKKTKKDGKLHVKITLGEYEDNVFMNRLAKFLMRLKTTP
jgi:hypothetical protein